jgi:hypothetical protein
MNGVVGRSLLAFTVQLKRTRVQAPKNTKKTAIRTMDAQNTPRAAITELGLDLLGGTSGMRIFRAFARNAMRAM